MQASRNKLCDTQEADISSWRKEGILDPADSPAPRMNPGIFKVFVSPVDE
jgi:hypothetical protein